MKKALWCLMLPAFLLFSCKKDHSFKPVSDKKTYAVNFNISGFNGEIMGATGTGLKSNSLKANAATGLAASINLLYYYVYDSNGRLVSKVSQDSTASNFGTISDHLTAGTYTVVFVGGKKGMSLNNDTTQFLNTACIVGYPLNFWQDTFFDKHILTIATGDVTQAITLKRIVGQVSIDILDEIPATAKAMQVTVTKEFDRYSFNTQSPYWSKGYAQTGSAGFAIPVAAVGKTHFKGSKIMMNTTTPFSAIITCYDGAGHVLGTATVNNVSVQVNTRTILTGHLFGTDNNFGMTLNQAWDPTPINVNF